VTNPLLKGKTYEKARSKTQIACKTIHDLTVSFSESSNINNIKRSQGQNKLNG
jgi:hypothetical protein